MVLYLIFSRAKICWVSVAFLHASEIVWRPSWSAEVQFSRPFPKNTVWSRAVLLHLHVVAVVMLPPLCFVQADRFFLRFFFFFFNPVISCTFKSWSARLRVCRFVLTSNHKVGVIFCWNCSKTALRMNKQGAADPQLAQRCAPIPVNSCVSTAGGAAQKRHDTLQVCFFQGPRFHYALIRVTRIAPDRKCTQQSVNYIKPT